MSVIATDSQNGGCQTVYSLPVNTYQYEKTLGSIPSPKGKTQGANKIKPTLEARVERINQRPTKSLLSHEGE